MVMYIVIIFNELFFLCKFKISKILIVNYENVHKLLETMPEFVCNFGSFVKAKLLCNFLTPSKA